jgi:hypothetical protein
MQRSTKLLSIALARYIESTLHCSTKGTDIAIFFFFFFLNPSLSSFEAWPHVGLYICLCYPLAPSAIFASASLAVFSFRAGFTPSDDIAIVPPSVFGRALLPQLAKRLQGFSDRASDRASQIKVPEFKNKKVVDTDALITHDRLWWRVGGWFKEKDPIITEAGTL